jgi:hypothetical protein
MPGLKGPPGRESAPRASIESRSLSGVYWGPATTARSPAEGTRLGTANGRHSPTRRDDRPRRSLERPDRGIFLRRRIGDSFPVRPCHRPRRRPPRERLLERSGARTGNQQCRPRGTHSRRLSIRRVGRPCSGDLSRITNRDPVSDRTDADTGSDDRRTDGHARSIAIQRLGRGRGGCPKDGRGMGRRSQLPHHDYQC